MDSEGDGIAGEISHLPVSERPVVVAAVQCVVSVILLRMERLLADLVLGITNAVHVPPWNGVIHWVGWVDGWKHNVRGMGSSPFAKDNLTVIIDIIVSEHNIDVLPILVLDEEIGQGGAVGNKLGNITILSVVINMLIV